MKDVFGFATKLLILFYMRGIVIIQKKKHNSTLSAIFQEKNQMFS